MDAPGRDAGFDDDQELSRLVAACTAAVAVAAAPRVFHARQASRSILERRAAIQNLRGMLTMLRRAEHELREASIVPPIDVDRVIDLAAELEPALGATTIAGYPSAAAVELARELAVELGVPKPSVGWDAVELDGADS